MRRSPELVTRLQWLMFFRVLLVTLLLGATLLFRLSEYDILTSERRLEFLV